MGVPAAERLGLLGGTFDPPHIGHLAAATRCREVLELDRVLLVVAFEPWQKTPWRRISPAEDRLALVEAAVDAAEGIEACRIEIDRGGPSYTIETVEELARRAEAAGRPAPEQFLIVGADLTASLSTWHRSEDLARAVTLVVVSRPSARAPQIPVGWRGIVVDGLEIEVSSSQVRSLLAAGESIEGLVPPAVERCIRARGLYAGGA